MSLRTNEEILDRHEKGLTQYASDERRLYYLIQAAYANKRAHALKIAIEATAVTSQTRPDGCGGS